jgi:chorismate mutase / prephenate dehydratase
MLDLNSKIHIVGGTGAMGTWLRNFLESLNFSVSVSDEKKKAENLESADIIFISVPIILAPEIIAETAKKSGKDSLIVDLSSIKSETKKALENCGREALSLHFLFGPSVHSIQNQKIIAERFGESKIANQLIELLKNEGAQVIEMESDLHDLTMAHIQSLTHFINLSLAEILIKNKVGITGQISTPVFLSQLSSTLRVLSQNPILLSEMQTLNPKFLKVVEDYLEIQKDLVKKIKAKEIKEIENQFSNLRKNLESISGKTESKIDVKNSQKKGIQNLRVGYLGPEGTFSNQATLELFDQSKNKLTPLKSIDDLFKSLDLDQVDIIVAPSENTIEGTVRETLDLLFDYNFKVIGKIDLPVSQCLLSKEKSIEKIDKVISHPQAINQSKKFLEENLEDVVLETSASTIASIEELGNPGVAIIGSSLAAEIYKLNILKKDIQRQNNNITRFNIIAKKDLLNLERRTKSLLFLSVFNRVGVLRDILSVFADLSINLNKIESRPSGEKHWDYYFYIEVEATDENPKFIEALNILKQYCPKIIILGKL